MFGSPQETANEFDRARARFGGQVTPELAIQIGLLDQVMQQLSTEALLQVETDDLGLGVGDDQIATFIRERFVDDLGNFNRNAYETFLFNNQQSEAEFVAGIRSELTRNILLGGLIASRRPRMSLSTPCFGIARPGGSVLLRF